MPSFQTSQLSTTDVEKAKSWVQEMYQMADSKNVGMVPKFLHEEAVLNFSQTTPLKGRNALEKLFTWEYAACTQIVHRILAIQVSYNQIQVQVVATYRFKDGSQRSLTYLAVWYKTPQEKQASRVDLEGDFLGIFQKISSFGGPPPL